MWFRRIPIGEVLIKRGITDSVVCFCCNDSVHEYFIHLFIFCSNSTHVWKLFTEPAGLHFPLVQLRQILEE